MVNCDCDGGKDAEMCSTCKTLNCPDCVKKETMNEGELDEFTIFYCKVCDQEIDGYFLD